MPGLDRAVIARANPELVFSRILADSQTDLIVAPHYDHLYGTGAHLLWAKAASILASGTYEPDLPLLLSVPKPRGFNRPGGIVHPMDRIVYQLLGNEAAPAIEKALDRSRVYSSRLLEPDPDGRMFLAHGESYAAFHAALKYRSEHVAYFVKLDIANYYERLPQHSLINMLPGIGCDERVISLLEKMLLAFRQNQSIGIVQGLLPSDLLGNFYLSSFDAQCDVTGIDSARFVDDIYMSCDGYRSARPILTWAIEKLRQDGLHLNELKSGFYPADRVATDANEIRDRFISTVNELRESGVEDYIFEGYGFRQVIPDPIHDIEDVDADGAAQAIERLLEMDKEAGTAELTGKIDSFAMPVLTALQNDMAIDRALRGIIARPYLAQLYAVYLSRFVRDNADLRNAIFEQIARKDVGAYERMLLLAALQTSATIDASQVRTLLVYLADPREVEPIRALCAILAAKFGSAQQQRAVKLRYDDEPSPFMRAALLFAAQYMSPGDRSTCKRVWGSHNVVNGILASTI